MTESKRFVIEWCIENFKVCPPKICTPPFYVGILRGTRWRLILYPTDYTILNRIGLYLQREYSDDGMDEILVDFELSIQGTRELSQISKSFRNIRFSVNDVCGHSEFPKYPPAEKLVLICILSESDGEKNKWSSKKDSEFLSTQLHALLKNKLFPDIHFICEGRKFYAHKAILAARCPKFLSYLENEIQIGLPEKMDICNVISANSLNLLLYYIYSGKLDPTLSEIPSDLYTIAIRFEMFDLCRTMKNFSDSCTVKTNFKAQRHHLIWWVVKKPFKPLIRIIRTGTNDSRGLIISINVRNNTRVRERIFMEFELRGFPPNANVYVAFRAFVKNTKNYCLMEMANIHLLTEGDKWAHCSNIPLTRILPEQFILDCIIDIYDGEYSSVIENSISKKLLFSNFTLLPNDMMQLLKKESNSDFILEIENELIRVHRAILASRCQFFHAMLTNETREKISGRAKIEAVSLPVMKLVLSYLYSGRLEELTFEECVDLYEISNRFLLTDLRKKCSSSFTTFKNIDINLIRNLADLFDDQNLRDKCKIQFAIA